MRINETAASPWRLLVVGALMAFAVPASQAASEVNRIAITIDDLDVNADDTPRLNLDQRNDAIRPHVLMLRSSLPEL